MALPRRSDDAGHPGGGPAYGPCTVQERPHGDNYISCWHCDVPPLGMTFKVTMDEWEFHPQGGIPVVRHVLAITGIPVTVDADGWQARHRYT